MSQSSKSFADLLNEAPLSEGDGTVSLSGSQSRSPQEGKFVLTLADGRSVTLDTDSVRSHAHLGGAVGQPVVQVNIPADRLPPGVGAPLPSGPPKPLPQDLSIISQEQAAHPTKPLWQDISIISQETVLFQDIPFKGPWDIPAPGGGGGTAAETPAGPAGFTTLPATANAVTPFALATPHQAPAQAVSAMRAAVNGHLHTVLEHDVQKAIKDMVLDVR